MTEHHHTHPPGVTDSLDTVQNVRHDNYWETVPVLAGVAYEKISRENARTASRLTTALREGTGATARGLEQKHTSGVAEKWYRTLGTHNSLYGARSDLELAVASMLTADGEEERPKTIDAFKRLLEDTPVVPDGDKLLAVQMLIDASKDLSPVGDSTDSGVSASGFYIGTAKRAAAAIFHRLKQVPAERPNRDETDAEKTQRLEKQRLLSDALKFKHEAGYLEVLNKTDEYWQNEFSRDQQKMLEDKAVAPTRESRALAAKYRYIDSPEELRDAALVGLTYTQVNEFTTVVDRLSNGEASEHYFGFLLRHAIYSKGKDSSVSATTARQDQPHDHVVPKRGVHKLSHDAVVVNHFDNTTQFVQLKAGNADRHYHDGITVVDLFLEDGLDVNDKSNGAIRREVQKGTTQLQAALAEWLGVPTPYTGSFALLESHVAHVNRALSNDSAKLVSA